MKINNHETYLDIRFNILSETTAMSCYSYSLPAGKSASCPFENGNICGSCYAQINMYNMNNVVKSQWARFLWTKDLIESNLPVWVERMVDVIKNHVSNGYFRIHDSGDFYHPDYIWAWYYICKSLPDIKFWGPTRVWQAKQINWIAPLRRLAMLPNVSIRPSSLNLDELEFSYDFLAAPTAVVVAKDNANNLGASICPKSINHNSCEESNCRKCWDKNGEVAYLLHGYLGRNEEFQISEKIINKRNAVAKSFVELSMSIKNG